MEGVLKNCRLCQSQELEDVLDLGQMAYTGIFPNNSDIEIPKAPLRVVKCGRCDLAQLSHSFDTSFLYGPHYGYRSNLNKSMAQHLRETVSKLEKLVALYHGDVVIDIGSNDGTTLNAYANKSIKRVGIDPSAEKLKKYYEPGIEIVVDFFPSNIVTDALHKEKAKVVTSIAMFYDLESPVDFACAVAEVLHDEGVWLFEQSYLPAMLEASAYDTICHEHLEYYGLKQVLFVLEKANLKPINIEFNKVNGGSFAVYAAHKNSAFVECANLVETILQKEESTGIHSLKSWKYFQEKIEKHKKEVCNLLGELKQGGRKVFGYGASTKGNVILQYCGVSSSEIPFIAEVNEDKFGCFTPGTKIPIISEAEARVMKPDYFFVFPWHFKNSILQREQLFLSSGGNLIFPLPELEIV